MANFNINKVIIAGRMCADPELRATAEGVSVTSFTVAVNRRTKDGTSSSDFIDVTAWRGTAEFIVRYFRKGSSVCISGELRSRTWLDRDKVKRYGISVLAEEAYFVDSKGESGAVKPGTGEAAGAGPAYIPDAYKGAPEFKDADEEDLPL